MKHIHVDACHLTINTSDVLENKSFGSQAIQIQRRNHCCLEILSTLLERIATLVFFKLEILRILAPVSSFLFISCDQVSVDIQINCQILNRQQLRDTHTYTYDLFCSINNESEMLKDNRPLEANMVQLCQNKLRNNEDE